MKHFIAYHSKRFPLAICGPRIFWKSVGIAPCAMFSLFGLEMIYLGCIWCSIAVRCSPRTQPMRYVGDVLRRLLVIEVLVLGLHLLLSPASHLLVHQPEGFDPITSRDGFEDSQCLQRAHSHGYSTLLSLWATRCAGIWLIMS